MYRAILEFDQEFDHRALIRTLMRLSSAVLEDSFVLHNSNGPALIEFYENGILEYAAYYINGKQHREDGPAVFWNYSDGKPRQTGLL